MDLLTHLFLPVTVAYVLRPDLFPSPWYLSLAVFAVLPDADKLLGLQGAFHSALTLGLLGGVLVVVEQWVRDDVTYALLISALLFSHLALDILDGGPVPLLYPLVDVGIGLHYPTELVLGETIRDSGIRDPVPTVRTFEPSRTRTSYPVVNGYGVLSGLVFVVIYAADRVDSLQ